MANDVIFQSTTLASPPANTKVETLETAADGQRQVMTISPRDLTAGDSIGALTETAPATDTASSGLNGRLQRLAQRLTTVLARTMTEKWIAGSGAGLTWTTAVTSSVLNSIVSGNAIISDVAIDNSSALDIFCDATIVLASLTSGAGAPYVGIYVYPLNGDGSTYGDGRFGSSAARRERRRRNLHRSMRL